MIRAIFVTLTTFLYILFVGFPALIYSWVSKETDTLYRVGIAGGRLALWLAGIRVEVHGAEKIPHGRPAIYLANHQSNCDPPVVITCLPPVLVMAKKEFFKVPVLGRAITLRGFIPVDRKNREQAHEAVDRAVAAMKAGHSFMAYPEGTRSPDGRLRPFKKGVFVLAVKSGALVVPISVSGATKVMPKGQFVIRPSRVRVTFHDPIPAEDYTLETIRDLVERTRQAIIQGLEPEEWPAP
jgi:1-acyl-sn-glycerol-3-phosphate acyltransferase